MAPDPLRRKGLLPALVSRALLPCAVALLGIVSSGAGQTRADGGSASSATPWEAFDADWDERWKEMRLARNETEYEVVLDDGESVLQGTSERAASVLLRQVDARFAATSTLEWRWRVSTGIPGNRKERTRDGDDYAARVFVIFGSGELNGDTRALSYVWASHEPAGSVFRSPYVSGVATVVLESGDERAGRWVVERVDIAADYRRVFEAEPEPVAAIALMVDTDNTGAQARASFDSIVLRGPVDESATVVGSP